MPSPAPFEHRDHRTTWDNVHPWRRQPCDTDELWKAFQRFLYQRARPRRGPMGSVDVVCARITWGWDWRAEQWDNETDAAKERRESTAASRHRRLAIRAQRLGDGEISALLAAQRAAPAMIGLLRPADALRFVSEGIDLERAAMGLTPAVGVPQGDPLTDDGLDLSALEDHEVETLRALVAKAQR